jgi:hypothetical protein
MGGIMKSADVIILCEDQAHNTFARAFLKRRNFNPKRVRTLPIPGRNGGSGEAYVRRNFPDQLKAIRKRANAMLVVLVDADTKSVEERKQELMTECERNGVPERGDGEHVVLIVPKRNVETWLVYLTGGEVDEETSEWKKKKDDLAKPAGNALDEMCHVNQRLRDPSPPSLVEACSEWKKFGLK